MKKLTNDQKEQINIYTYDKGLYDLNIILFPQGVNATLEALGYKDRLIYDGIKQILVWSLIDD